MRVGLLTASLVACVFLFSCGRQSTSSSPLREAWNGENDPQQMESELVVESTYITDFSQLPLEGKLSSQPWSGDYWATDHGGIAFRWHARGSLDSRRGFELISPYKITNQELRTLSPAEKFDLLLGHNDYPLTRKERKRTQVLKIIKGHRTFEQGFKIPDWEGLCHAWAVATMVYKEPKPVSATVLRGPHKGMKIPFGSADIKALLTYFLHEVPAETKFLGQRCEFNLGDLEREYQDGSIDEATYRQQREACLDTNAGAFHLVLANQLGRLDEGFVFDVTKEAEVWNHPVYSFKSTVLETHEGASPHAAEGTVQEVLLKTVVKYIVEVDNNWFPDRGGESIDEKIYHYRLELNKDGQIIGGAWPDDEADRPDFLWKSEVPEFRGVYAPLGNLYRQSVSE